MNKCSTCSWHVKALGQIWLANSHHLANWLVASVGSRFLLFSGSLVGNDEGQCAKCSGKWEGELEGNMAARRAVRTAGLERGSSGPGKIAQSKEHDQTQNFRGWRNPKRPFVSPDPSELRSAILSGFFPSRATDSTAERSPASPFSIHQMVKKKVKCQYPPASVPGVRSLAPKSRSCRPLSSIPISDSLLLLNQLWGSYTKKGKSPQSLSLSAFNYFILLLRVVSSFFTSDTFREWVRRKWDYAPNCPTPYMCWHHRCGQDVLQHQEEWHKVLFTPFMMAEHGGGGRGRAGSHEHTSGCVMLLWFFDVFIWWVILRVSLGIKRWDYKYSNKWNLIYEPYTFHMQSIHYHWIRSPNSHPKGVCLLADVFPAVRETDVLEVIFSYYISISKQRWKMSQRQPVDFIWFQTNNLGSICRSTTEEI